MEVTTQKTNVDQIDFFKQDSEAPANFLRGFFPEKPNITNSSSNPKEIDLSLKLSLDGPYGQNAEEMPLTRSSAIAGELTLMANSSVPSLDRSSSLPVDAERVLVRFGDLQAMRRLETGKRWLQEKMRRAAAAEAKKSPAAAAASKVPAASPAIDKLKMLANPSADSSKHEGSRGLAEVGDGSNIMTSANKGKDIMVYPKTIVKDLPSRPADTKLENPSKKARLLDPCSLRGGDIEILRKMPSVTTTGDGPGGKRIQGFLYTYRRGQVCIVCVCHGSFLSPAEFVMHAGGKDVANPMKHITVCSNSF